MNTFLKKLAQLLVEVVLLTVGVNAIVAAIVLQSYDHTVFGIVSLFIGLVSIGKGANMGTWSLFKE
jgi:uncharacterized membrane protein